MKDLGKTKYSLGFEIEHKSNGTLIYQFVYIEKLLKILNMDNVYPLSTSMVVITLRSQEISISSKK